MFPSIHIFDLLTFSVQSLLQACGVLASLAVVERLALRQRLRPDYLWTVAVLMGISLFLGEHLVLLLEKWHDFLAHPLWMLGLLTVRDPRLFDVGVVIALTTGCLYLLARRVPLGRAASVLTPAVLLLLAFVHAGYFTAGAQPGRVTSLRWGLISTNRFALAAYGTPLHVPLIPVAAWACLGYTGIALFAAALAARGRDAFAAPIFAAGLLTILLGQLELHWAGEMLFLGLFTWTQELAIAWTLLGAALLLHRIR